MTENLLQKLEEKMMMMLTEVEDLHKEVHRLHHENAALKAERERHGKKIENLINLLESVSTVEKPVVNLGLVGKEQVSAQG